MLEHHKAWHIVSDTQRINATDLLLYEYDYLAANNVSVLIDHELQMANINSIVSYNVYLDEIIISFKTKEDMRWYQLTGKSRLGSEMPKIICKVE